MRNFHQRMNCTILEILTEIPRLFVPKLNALIVPPKFNLRQRDERGYTDFALRFKLAKKMALCGSPVIGTYYERWVCHDLEVAECSGTRQICTCICYCHFIFLLFDF